MKTLRCEMCGSNNLLKEEGVFVCQNCGTRYSVEEAKKMMIEGTVEVQGTVKINKNDEIAKLYKLARRAKESGDSKLALSYYEQILLENPNDWEAVFYRLVFDTKSCTLAQMESKLYNFANSIEPVFKIVAQEEVSAKKAVIFAEIQEEIMRLLLLFGDNFLERASEYMSFDTAKAREMLAISSNSRAKVGIVVGDCFLKYADDKEKALRMYETYGVQAENELKSIAIKKIKDINPSYIPPKNRNSGCYVATCVYGSYDCPEVWTLRRYRDNTLGATWYGRAFIKTYYAISPTLVKWFGKTKWFKKLWKTRLDKMVNNLQEKGVESTPYQDKHW